MANYKRGSERYNDRMAKIFDDAKQLERERLKRGEMPNPNLTSPEVAREYGREINGRNVERISAKGTATATPWRTVKAMNNKPPYIAGPDACDFVADMLGKDGKLDLDRMTANAELIVLAVNAHAELVEALMWAMKHVSKHGTYTYEDNYRKAKAALRKAGAL